MKPIWIYILAIVIGQSSMILENPKFDFKSDALVSLKKIPQLQANVLKNDSKNNSDKNTHIAQDFIPMLVIADAPDSENEFLHYLPIYSLVRQKEYFLLI